MVNLKQKIILMGLVLMLAACSSETTTATFARTQRNQERPARPRPLPGRVRWWWRKIVTVDGVLALKTPTIAVGFDASGIVNAVNVTLGQTVKRVMCWRRGRHELQDAVADAQTQLDSAQASIAQQNNPPPKKSWLRRRRRCNSAYASYNTTKAGSTASRD